MKGLTVFIILSGQALAYDFSEKEFKQPVREVSIIVTDTGFYPDHMLAFEGERLKFFVTSTSKKSQCFVLQKHEVFVAADKGMVNEGETVVENSGKFKFYCPSFPHEGTLTVMQKFGEQEERKPASVEEEKPKYWMPRDFD